MEGLILSLRSLGATALGLAKRLGEYRSLLSAPVNNVHQREQILAEVAKQAAALPAEVRANLEEWIAAERAEIEGAKAEFRFEFGRQLLAALGGSGMTVRGQLPLLRVGLFTIKAEFAAGTATVFWGPEIEKLKSGIRLEPLTLAKTVRSFGERLTARTIPPERLLGQLATAYERYCLINGQNVGSRVFLLDLLSELVLLLQPASFRLNPTQEKFVDYPRIRFSYDLYRLKQAGQFVTDNRRLKLHVANFDATIEKAKALWVPDNDAGEGTHYSYVSFTVVE